MAGNENKLLKPLKFAYFSFSSFSSLFDVRAAKWDEENILILGYSMRYIEENNFSLSVEKLPIKNIVFDAQKTEISLTGLQIVIDYMPSFNYDKLIVQ